MKKKVTVPDSPHQMKLDSNSNNTDTDSNSNNSTQQLDQLRDADVNAEVRADVLRLSIAVQRMQMLATKSGLLDSDGMPDSSNNKNGAVSTTSKGHKHSRPLSSSNAQQCPRNLSEEGNTSTPSESNMSSSGDGSGAGTGPSPNPSHHGHSHGQGHNHMNGLDQVIERNKPDECDAASQANINLTVAESENLRVAFAKLEKMLRSECAEIQLEATKKFRQLLSMERDPMLQELVDRDIVPQLLHFLKDKSNYALQVEALWALTNIAAGTTEHTHLLIKNNAVPTLVGLLNHQHHEVLEQAVWVLGNIAGDDATARDTVLSAGALEPLLKCMDENRKSSFLRIATWTLSNLCDGQPRPIFDVVAVLNTVKRVLDTDDTEVLSHACWALSHLCDGPSPHIQDVVKANVCPRLVELLKNKAWRVVKPALRTVGNIVCAEDDQDYTQHIIECGAVPCLRQLIGHSNREIQKEACWTISNISAGTVDQIQCVLDSGGIPPLVELASEEANTDPDVKIEACWVLLNATSCGSDGQIEQLVRAGCVQVLCNLLHDTSMVMMALEGLEKILQVGEDIALSTRPPGTNPHAILLDTKKIEGLQHHRSTAISKRANRMWKQHFVTCAICETAYSRHSPSTAFCNECKCNVCTNCDCSIFHLSYQDQLWREMAEGEADKEKSKQESKKSKRQKKRMKDKKKKEQLKAMKDVGPEDKAGKSKSNNNNNKAKGKADETAPPPADEKPNKKSSKEKEKDKAPENSANKGSKKVSSMTAQPESNEKKTKGKEPAVKENQQQKPQDVSSNDIKSAKANQDTHSQSKKGTTGTGTAPVAPSSSTGNNPKVATKKNEQYVDFLMQTGSILDLWNMMNDGEDVNPETKRAPVKSNSKR